MIEPRIRTLASVLVQYSLALRPGDKILLGGGVLALPLLRETYRAALHAGAYPTVRITDEGLDELLLREGTAEQVGYVSELDHAEVDYYNAQLSINAPENMYTLSGVDPQQLALMSTAYAPLNERQLQRAAAGSFRWYATMFPTPALAQAAEMSLAEYAAFVLHAGFLDQDDPLAAWRAQHERQERIVQLSSRHTTFRIVAPGTDLVYRVVGRPWLNASGTHNFPDGEVYTSPLEDSMEGELHIGHPVVYAGQTFRNLHLRFAGGKVVAATADSNQVTLDALLDTDAGSRFVGEVAFGLNDRIERLTHNAAFDEKMGGTTHLALGQSFPEADGKNQSGIHWDLVCDLRAGQVYADGVLCYADGAFLKER